MRAEGKDDRTDRVLVVTPPGTARATLGTTPLTLDASGAAVTVLAAGATAAVTAYPAGGLPRSPPPSRPSRTDSGGLPGDSPKTRIVA